MKIALCTPSLSRVGGSNSFMFHLALQLRELGHEVSMWTLAQKSDGGVFALKRGTRKEASGTLKIGEDIIAWPELHERHDVVHITNAGQVYLGFEELLDKNLGPTVLTVHDPHEMLVNQREGRFLRLIDVANRVHFIGKAYHDHFRLAGYIPTADFDRKAVWARQPYVPMERLSEMPNHDVTCTSNWRWNKGIINIVKAAEILARSEEEFDLQFWTSDRMEDVWQQVRVLKGWENCSCCGEGYDPSEFRYGAYAARVLVDMVYFDEYDTGRTEYPILEAWNFGVTPVISERFAGKSPSDYTKGQDVYVSRPDPTDLALALRFALMAPLPVANMNYRLREHGTQQSGAVIARTYEELLAP